MSEDSLAEVLPATKQTADVGAEAIAQLGSQSPNVDGTDATIIGLAIEIGAGIVAGDANLTYERT